MISGKVPFEFQYHVYRHQATTPARSLKQERKKD